MVFAGITLLGFLPTLFNFREGKFFVGEWMMIAFVSMFFIKNMWLRLFMVWALSRHIFGFFEIGTVSISAQIKYFKLSYCTLNTLFMYVVAYQLFANTVKRSHTKHILNGICIITLVHCLFILLQFCGVWIFVQPRVGMNVVKGYFDNLIIIADPFNIIGKRAHLYTGLLDNTNMTSSLLLLGLPAFFRKKWVWLVPIVAACLILAKSMGGIIPATVITVVFLIFKLKRKHMDKAILACSFVIIAVALYVYTCDDFGVFMSGSGRFKAWTMCLNDPILQRWVEGWGLGQYKIAFNVISNTIYGNVGLPMVAHNAYIQTLFELGTIGLFLALGFVISLFRNIVKSGNEYRLIIAIGVIAALLNAGVNFLFHTTVAWLALVYFALLQTQTKE